MRLGSCLALVSLSVVSGCALGNGNAEDSSAANSAIEANPPAELATGIYAFGHDETKLGQIVIQQASADAVQLSLLYNEQLTGPGDTQSGELDSITLSPTATGWQYKVTDCELDIVADGTSLDVTQVGSCGWKDLPNATGTYVSVPVPANGDYTFSETFRRGKLSVLGVNETGWLHVQLAVQGSIIEGTNGDDQPGFDDGLAKPTEDGWLLVDSETPPNEGPSSTDYWYCDLMISGTGPTLTTMQSGQCLVPGGFTSATFQQTQN